MCTGKPENHTHDILESWLDTQHGWRLTRQDCSQVRLTTRLDLHNLHAC